MRMTPDQFVDRIACELELQPDEARGRVRAVFGTISEAVTWGEFEDVILQLEPEYADRFA